MADRLDIIIFGATGFTGKHTIPPVEKLSKDNGRNLSWGIAGRNEGKLKDVLKEMGKKIGKDLDSTPIVIADVADEESLKKMASQARIIINTCGPYRFYGEPVIKACIEAGTHHVDVSGEPQFLENMQLKYNEQARSKGVYIIGACGFDSIPADMGIHFMKSNFNGTVNSIESYLTTKVDVKASGPSINYGTWESAVYGLAYYNELKEIRKKLFKNKLPVLKPKLNLRGSIHRSDVAQGYALPFLGSDKSVAQRSQRFFYEEEKKRPIQIQTYFTVPSIIAVFLMAFFGGIFMLLAKFELGRKLLLNYPRLFSGGFFSHEGPSEEVIENTRFRIDFKAEGWSEKLAEADDQFTTPPNKRVIGVVKGRNPGYGTTTTALTLSAIMILQESGKMPNNGGVYSPAAAFGNTSIIEELNKNELTFEIVKTEEIKE